MTELAPLSLHMLAEICVCVYKTTCSILLPSGGIRHCPGDALQFSNLEKVTLACAFFVSFSLYLYLKTQSEYMVHEGEPGLTERGVRGACYLLK